MRTTDIAFYVVVGILIIAFACALAWWIVEAVFAKKSGARGPDKGTSEEQDAGEDASGEAAPAEGTTEESSAGERK